MSDKFIYCPRCDKSDGIYETDYEVENDNWEPEVDDNGRACSYCGWEGDVGELVCKDDEKEHG